MKILILLLSASLFLSTFTFYQEQESPELKEAIELTNSLVKLFNEGKYDEALPLAKRALQIREKLLPRTDARVTNALVNLAEVYLAKKDYNSAKQTFERALPLQEERFGPTHEKLGPTLDRLAVLYHFLGNMSKAEDMYQRALAVREKAFGPENVKVAEPLFSLARFYRYRKEFDRAFDSYKRVVNIYGKVSGITSAEFERASTALMCLAYESENKAYLKEAEMMRSLNAPLMQSLEPYDVLNGRAVKLEKPVYPDAARYYGLAGNVIVLVEIDEKGKVISASDMCQGSPYLVESCIQAALKSRFTPTIVSGVPSKAKGVIQYRFVHQGPVFR
ncbi:MAG TPA: TonB family protein [Pyrinomonadaceae bacterium]|nr:TonB family protein [Pyrinomonadaceae bacterium]